MTNENTAMVPYEQQHPTLDVIRPLVDPRAAKQAIEQYEALKTAIVRDDDKQYIQGRTFLKKSFWRRVATCFGLSLELVSEERVVLDDRLAYRVMYRASAPNGRWMDGDGMCTQGEKGQMIEHNIRAIAHTRAKNRAISDLVGGGEVSAEEVPEDEPRRPPAPQAAQEPRTTVHAVPSEPEPTEEPAPTPAARIVPPLQDPKLITLMQEIGVWSVEQQETFIAQAQADYPRTELRAACYKLVAQRKMDRAHKSLAEAPVGTRGN